jgi:hypothetical protein
MFGKMVGHMVGHTVLKEVWGGLTYVSERPTVDALTFLSSTANAAAKKITALPRNSRRMASHRLDDTDG